MLDPNAPRCHCHTPPTLPTAPRPGPQRLLLTGLHVVADIYCNGCDTRLGWKYVEAFEPSQKYKEGRFIVEKIKIIEGNDL